MYDKFYVTIVVCSSPRHFLLAFKKNSRFSYNMIRMTSSPLFAPFRVTSLVALWKNKTGSIYVMFLINIMPLLLHLRKLTGPAHYTSSSRQTPSYTPNTIPGTLLQLLSSQHGNWGWWRLMPEASEGINRGRTRKRIEPNRAQPNRTEPNSTASNKTEQERNDPSRTEPTQMEETLAPVSFKRYN